MSQEKVNEKAGFSAVEKDKADIDDLSALGPLPEIGTPERRLAERKLLRKLDMRLMPIVV
jgi:hypothetical protein